MNNDEKLEICIATLEVIRAGQASRSTRKHPAGRTPAMVAEETLSDIGLPETFAETYEHTRCK